MSRPFSVYSSRRPPKWTSTVSSGRGISQMLPLFQPVVRHLGLIAVDELLAEKAEFIADGAAHGGQFHGGQRIQEAGRQTAKAAVAQARFRLQFEDGVLVDAQFLERLRVVVLVDEVDDVGMQRAAGEELGAEVVDLFLALRLRTPRDAVRRRITSSRTVVASAWYICSCVASDTSQPK